MKKKNIIKPQKPDKGKKKADVIQEHTPCMSFSFHNRRLNLI